MAPFRWNDWNLGHIGEHGVLAHEAEEVLAGARRPYPERMGDGKFRVRGPSVGDRLLQVIFILDPPDTIYVIHARDLTPNEKRQYRRRTR